MAIVLVISSLLNIAYLLPVAVNALFRQPPAGTEQAVSTGIKEAPLACLIPLSITALAGLFFFLFPGLGFDLAQLLTK